ncbi:MAG: hypothetical protein IT195_00850 [Microthrixaceae bacterium]|nr:hypothetical protein [Microthrixaceae bacterium]
MIRRLVLAVFVAGILGMIVGSVADSNGAALTFGLLTAASAVSLMLVTAVTSERTSEPPASFDEATAAQIEARITSIVQAGADEADVRDLVRDAVRLGRSGTRASPPA